MDAQTPSTTEEGNDAALRRRKVLKLGVYAAYTAPALLAMATAAKAQTGSAIGGECSVANPENCGFGF